MGGKVIQPYWTSRCGRHVLYNADCLEVLPGLTGVDAVVTDPPYGLEDWNNRGINSSQHRTFCHAKTQQWDQPINAQHILEMRRVSRAQIIWGWNHFSDLLPRTKQVLVWNKCVRGMHFNDCELAWASQFKEACRIFDYSPNSMTEAREHPTQKPLAVMEWCVTFIKGTTILDPFTGSGTTGVACIRTGRRFIGIEISREYCDIAVRRLERELSQPRLPGMEPERMVQRELLEAR